MFPETRRQSRPRSLRHRPPITWLSLWKVTFAVVAVADLMTCSHLLVQGWNWAESSSRESSGEAVCSIDDGFHKLDSSVSSYACHYSRLASQYYWIGPLFCLLCVIEAVVRAIEARTLAIENNALDAFEKGLSRVYSTTRLSFGFLGATTLDANMDQVLARSTLRVWIPVSVTLCFWLVLLPINLNFACGNDSALATFWISSFFAKSSILSTMAQERLISAFWKLALPYRVSQPKRFYNRIRQLLRIIRFVRFAGPLARMGLKLWDQLRALTKTWRQSLGAQAEKDKRLHRPSMLLDDIKRVESLAKMQTRLAALPSQLFTRAQVELAPVYDALLKQQERGRQISRQLQQLKGDLTLNLRTRTRRRTSELYDRVVLLTQDLKATVNNNTLLSSYDLISPRSRFSVIWRMTVTNCLLLEMFRLGVSWHITRTFNVSLTQIMSRLFIHCEVPEITKQFRFITDRVDDIRMHLSNVIPLLPPPEKLIMCVPSSPSAKLFLQLGGLLESFIDVVSFFDIFIWFLTGDLDVAGVVTPKPFFSRCILPGTLVQVLDHPTLPGTLPTLISQAMEVATATGWSRVIRWVLAIAPAFWMLVVNPLKSYFFRHFDTTVGLMRYAESCGMLTPARASLRSMGNLKGPYVSYGTNLLSVESYPSQVGMSFDSPTLPGRRMVSMASSDESMGVPPPLELPPSILRPSTIRFEDSVSFDDQNESFYPLIENEDDEGSDEYPVGYQYSVRIHDD